MSQSVTSTYLLDVFRDDDSTTFLASLFQCLTILLVDISPNAQSKPPVVQAGAVSLCPMHANLKKSFLKSQF